MPLRSNGLSSSSQNPVPDMTPKNRGFPHCHPRRSGVNVYPHTLPSPTPSRPASAPNSAKYSLPTVVIGQALLPPFVIRNSVDTPPCSTIPSKAHLGTQQSYLSTFLTWSLRARPGAGYMYAARTQELQQHRAIVGPRHGARMAGSITGGLDG